MKKELLGAIIIGIIVGLFVVVGIYQARQAVLVGDTPLNPSPTVSSSNTPVSLIRFINPAANSVLTTDSTTVTAASPFSNTPYLLLVNETPYMGKTDAGGNLSQGVKLTEGANVLQLELIQSDGRLEHAEQMVAYFTSLPEASASSQATPSASPKASANPTTPRISTSPRPTPRVTPTPKSTP
jgi:hypothetical protein